jgi:hypothetical protein
VWVQLASLQNIEVAGSLHTYRPGDWVDVGKQTAMLWISTGQAVLHGVVPGSVRALEIADGSGLVVPEGYEDSARALRIDVPIVEGEPSLRFERTCWWDMGAAVSPAMIPVGLSLLDTWEMVVPLYDYKTLACHVGTEFEQAQTKAIIRDLRVPLYDTRLIFARRSPDTERLFKLWAGDDGLHRGLAFLRALYQVKPLILALPATWTGWNYAE